MNYKAFNNYLNTVLNAIYAQDEHLEKKDEQTFTEHGRWALNRLETIFCDKKTEPAPLAERQALRVYKRQNGREDRD